MSGALADLDRYAGQLGALGSRELEPAHTADFLDGWLNPFKLTLAAARRTPTPEAVVFTGLIPFWPEAGVPQISFAELRRFEGGRLRRIIHTTFAHAVATGQLDRLTTLTGRPLADLVRRVRAEG